MNWKDITTYSQGRSKIPKIFRADLKDLKLVVTRHIDHDPDAWVLTCAPWFECHELCKGEPVEVAQEQALKLVTAKLQAVLKALT